MVALALMPNPHETDKWEYFDIPFDYQRYGKMIEQCQISKGRNIKSVSFSTSSKDGATFEGAPGSTLLVDEVELTYE